MEDDDATRDLLADHLTADSYGVLLLDVMLPDASGFELCRRLRQADGIAQRIDPELPVIMLSGRASETDRIRGLARGADDYVAKPMYELFSAS